MQFMIYYSNTTHLIIKLCDRPTVYQTCATPPISKQEQQNNFKALSIVKTNDLAQEGTNLYPIIDRT